LSKKPARSRPIGALEAGREASAERDPPQFARVEHEVDRVQVVVEEDEHVVVDAFEEVPGRQVQAAVPPRRV
jgi:hypothetical protein